MTAPTGIAFFDTARGMRSPLAWVGLVTVLLAVLAVAAGPARRQHVCMRLGICRAVDPALAMLMTLRDAPLPVLHADLAVAMPPASGADATIHSASVDYVLDLSAMPASDLGWDAKTATLHIARPGVLIGRIQPQPAAGDLAAADDAADAAAQSEAQREAQSEAQSLLQARAASGPMLAAANHAADDQLTRLFQSALRAAGRSRAQVVVSHPAAHSSAG